jgi:hypothetical protein
VIGNPFPLKQNEGKSFMGSITLGKGFLLSPDEAKSLISKDARNKDVLFPYLNGDDVNSDPEQRPSRWVINFFDWSEEKSRSYPDCFEIVERLVKPERERPGNTMGRIKWWQFYRRGVDLYETISKLDQVMVVPLVSKYSLFEFVPGTYVYMHKLAVFALNDFQSFAILSSSLHNAWCWRNSSTLGAGTLNYSITDCFETFPLPLNVSRSHVAKCGSKYYFFRKQLTEKLRIGLTDLQNSFHNSQLQNVGQDSIMLEDKAFEKKYGKNTLWLRKYIGQFTHVTFGQAIEDIKQLRQLFIELDLSTLATYGWTDIQLEHGFYELPFLPENDRIRFTVHPSARKEFLKRLFNLNHDQYLLNTRSQTEHGGQRKRKIIRQKSSGLQELFKDLSDPEIGSNQSS